MTWVDYSIVLAILAFMTAGALACRNQMQSVSDFLAAGRTARRYMTCVSEWIAGVGAITIVANFEMYFQSGFPMVWWDMSMSVVVLLVTASGWVVYRFRQTRAMTMAQFFEMRYSRRFRIFTGAIAFLSGIVNFGIFPAVGARFFIYFCGLPHSFPLLGLEISTFAFLMAALLLLSILFVFLGGQIAVIVTNFIQGTFVNIVFIAIILLFLVRFDRSAIFEALSTAPSDGSFLNPLRTGQAEDFNFWFFFIGVVGYIYNRLSWQGTQAYNASASNAHEAKMGQVLTNWRQIPQITFYVLAGVCAITVMRHSSFQLEASGVNSVLEGAEGAALKSQLTVPLVMKSLLPEGLMGAFTAVMLAAFLSTHTSYMHSWGSILVQDVLLPLRKKPFTPKEHIRALRFAILGVAVFIFFFSLLFQQSQYILLYFAVTGAIYAGGSGAVIIGGLYWKRGTTPAAWSAMITGSTVAVGGVILHQIYEGFFINGQVFWFLAILSSLLVYTFVSLLTPRPTVDMDRLLHRGRHDLHDEYQAARDGPARGWKWLGMGPEFTARDRAIYLLTYLWIFSWFGVFLFGTFYNLIFDVSDRSWMEFWYLFLILRFIASIAIVLWFTLGGVADLRYMFKTLKGRIRDHRDDGRVTEGEKLSKTVS